MWYQRKLTEMMREEKDVKPPCPDHNVHGNRTWMTESVRLSSKWIETCLWHAWIPSGDFPLWMTEQSCMILPCIGHKLKCEARGSINHPALTKPHQRSYWLAIERRDPIESFDIDVKEDPAQLFDGRSGNDPIGLCADQNEDEHSEFDDARAIPQHRESLQIRR